MQRLMWGSSAMVPLFALSVVVLAVHGTEDLDDPDVPPSWWVGDTRRSRRAFALDDVICGRGGNGPKRVWDTCAATKNKRRRGNRNIGKQIEEWGVCNFVADTAGCFYHELACTSSDAVGELFRTACPASCGECAARMVCDKKFDDTGCYGNIKLKGPTACDSSYLRKRCPAACHIDGCPQLAEISDNTTSVDP